MSTPHRPQAGNPLPPIWLPPTALTMGQHAPLLSWLQYQGSLTARLRGHCRGQFSVEVLHQYWGNATAEESRTLGVPLRARVLIREVLLKGYGESWVWARSLLPERSLTGSLRRLRKLDNQPLGGWLFKQPTLQRGPVTIRRFPVDDPHLPAHLNIGEPLWGRRSVFHVLGKPLLVSEVFLPPFVATL